MSKLDETWAAGGENPRESKRFRWPVYATVDAPAQPEPWPWIGLFETRDGADMAVRCVTEYGPLRTDNARLRRRIVELEAHVEGLKEPPFGFAEVTA